MEENTAMVKLPTYDIYAASFLSLNNIQPTLVKTGTRVVFEFDATSTVRNLRARYNENPVVHVLDFVHHLRRIRSQMLSAR